jgi:uncharacterized membrane protein
MTPPHSVPWPWPYNTEKTWRKMAIWELMTGAFIGIFTVPLAVSSVTQALSRHQSLSFDEMGGLILFCVFMIGIPATLLLADTRASLRHRRHQGPVPQIHPTPRHHHHG